MKTLHEAFLDFDKAITLTPARKDKIINSRNAVREKIRSYFKNDLEQNQPKFCWQGSFSMNLALNPLPDNEVDFDDGVYLTNIDTEDMSSWPTPKQAHDYILDAMADHTADGCENKTSCVRVIYRNFYHMDLPVYIMHNEHAHLANIKTNEWTISDSKDFRDWFYNNRKSEQTSRIIRYLKAWRDYLNLDIPSIELTILGTENFIEADEDSIAFEKTVRQIYNTLSICRSVFKPVQPNENLWEELSETQKDKRINDFKKLLDTITTANSTSPHRGSIILRNYLGDRFSEVPEEKQDIREFSVGASPWQIA